MLPFLQQFTNQNNASACPGGSQAVGVANNMSPNLRPIQPQMGFVNPQLSIPFDNNNPNYNPNLGNMNMPNFNALPNSHMSNSIVGSAQQIQSQSLGQNLNVLGFPMNGQLSNLGQLGNGQFGWQNQLPNVNQLGNMPLLNPSQINALTQLLGCANQVAQAINPQNTPFFGNSQLGFGQPNGGLHLGNFAQQLPVVPMQLPNVSGPPSNVVGSSYQHSQQMQSNHAQRQGMHNFKSSPHQNKKFVKNQKREASNHRPQRSQDHQIHNSKGNKDAGAANSDIQSKGGKRRSLAALYTEKEIQQWREERKKNYPSNSNVKKKLAQKQANAENADQDAKLRRQQLKDVLAKQVELGFEIPEIPSHYLVDQDHQDNRKDRSRKPINKGRFQKKGFQNRYNRAGKHDRKDQFSSKREAEEGGSFRKRDRYAKRHKSDNENLSETCLSLREPTLLKKLLSNDMKRDKTHLLQALRFMVMNSFFKDWPEKPLNFPKVIVEETGVESNVIEEMSSSFKGELNDDDDCDDDSSIEGDGKNDVPQEEGEITD
ncbi:uncharacterized protein LOC130828368 isoform X2 [Amaranthus tricolor]|uniref:uncharacterized protein LOC130828368 isoform X2 n=1 Tax=Amaranthus tricolor TaxID=29722 RepID=UPI00258C3099|nr:uncharacterized protein LOC130828368 isoform X2 [Amaranthus tricolor]